MNPPNPLAARYAAAPTFPQFLEAAVENRDLWKAVTDRAQAPETLVKRARALTRTRHLIALAEDWCGDAVNIVPVAARLAAELPGLDMKVFRRDENPDLMDAHLTRGARSIPVVILFDESFNELGWWGPRPVSLQEWVISKGLAMEKEARYVEVRKWYARDRGETTIEEIVSLMEKVERGAGG